MLHKSEIEYSKNFKEHQRSFIFRVPLTKDQQIIEPDWEIYLRDTARMIGEQQTPQRYVGFYSYFGSRIFFPRDSARPEIPGWAECLGQQTLGPKFCAPLIFI